MTQAITAYNILTSNGFDVCTVMIGCSSKREIPAFFYEQIASPVIKFQSPNFVTDNQNKSIKIIPSITSNLAMLPVFKQSMKVMKSVIKEQQPDLILNFYDPLIGLYYLFNNPKIPMISLAHQYLFHHPDFRFPKGHFLDRLAVKGYTRLTSIGSIKKLALSFYKLGDCVSKNIVVIPPLLRNEVFHQEVKNENFYLIYLVNHGYREEITKWHLKNPDIELHCFSDNKDVAGDYKYDDKLYFHQINDKKFLKLMAKAKGLICTAGFESVCEAMYLGKPVFMVPVEGHFEQFCNARDAFKAGAGIFDDKFNIDKFLEYVPSQKPHPEAFQKWVDTASLKILEEVNVVFKPGFSDKVSELEFSRT